MTSRMFLFVEQGTKIGTRQRYVDNIRAEESVAKVLKIALIGTLVVISAAFFIKKNISII